MNRPQEERVTNTSNTYFDLVSVLYHALEGAKTYAIYAQDAQRDGDQELAQFFYQAQQDQVRCAENAKQILARRTSPAATASAGIPRSQGTAPQS
ncbi:hypothetical protein EI42_03874 [Thermosporothrix hazakensis]|jgi:rubrerythrin|uniref:Ferritin-like diiron domain-containing protein n=2 Tax=Thermosporothrix TaxID=768650 RepID=A0A326U319_THEHA|nr:hypothetical protein [Thermosporothrix hazakensis]PZW26294.1 hypothetical protein EI42_03874 [Thermosporothrix hazakensis]BBH90702.1 hypothetical protein KTC_54530 [Thermosporothrix sp. COM3]GCE48753.1 hypothetical protein KTH_36220 [Thermosporothrix hazakensis]